MATLRRLRNEALLAEARLQRHWADARHDLRLLERRYIHRPVPVLAGAFAFGWLLARFGGPVFLRSSMHFVVAELQRVVRLAFVRALF